MASFYFQSFPFSFSISNAPFFLLSQNLSVVHASLCPLTSVSFFISTVHSPVYPSIFLSHFFILADISCKLVCKKTLPLSHIPCSPVPDLELLLSHSCSNVAKKGGRLTGGTKKKTTERPLLHPILCA